MSAEFRLAPQISTDSFESLPFTKVNDAGPFAGGGTGWIDTVGPADVAKRLIDITLSGILLLLAAPLVLATAALVALDGGSPFFGHERVGRGGSRFRCWKIRTMRPDASAHLEILLQVDPVCRRQWATERKLAPDPRATTVGRLLRRTSLDELPQLWNVLVGEMSLVGPRPVTGEELALYGASAGHYCAVRPGITGLWQVFRRPGTTYAERVAMDRSYVERRTLFLDALLLAMTLRAPFLPTGR